MFNDDFATFIDLNRATDPATDATEISPETDFLPAKDEPPIPDAA